MPRQHIDSRVRQEHVLVPFAWFSGLGGSKKYFAKENNIHSIQNSNSVDKRPRAFLNGAIYANLHVAQVHGTPGRQFGIGRGSHRHLELALRRTSERVDGRKGLPYAAESRSIKCRDEPTTTPRTKRTPTPCTCYAERCDSRLLL